MSCNCLKLNGFCKNMDIIIFFLPEGACFDYLLNDMLSHFKAFW